MMSNIATAASQELFRPTERPIRKGGKIPRRGATPQYRYVGADAEFRGFGRGHFEEFLTGTEFVHFYDVDVIPSHMARLQETLVVTKVDGPRLNWKPALVTLAAFLFQAYFVLRFVGLSALMISVIPTVFIFFYVLFMDVRKRMVRI